MRFKDLKPGDAFVFVATDSLNGAFRGEDACFFKQESARYVCCDAPADWREVDVTHGGMERAVLCGARAPFVRWHADQFELFVFHTYERRDGKWRLAYVLLDAGRVIFAGDDFFSPNDLDARWNVVQLLGFLSLQEGDTDPEYFASYTPEQIAWRDERAAELSLWVAFLEDEIAGGPVGTFELPADALA
jgi:hypothetical protein